MIVPRGTNWTKKEAFEVPLRLTAKVFPARVDIKGMNETLKASLKITAILSIEDTRQFEEVGDTWKPIPGSGFENTCHRCGRSHEVHATVRLEDGSEAIVGTGCAGADSVEMAAKFTKLDRAAKRLGMLQAERAAWLAKCATWDASFQTIKGLEQPKPEQVDVSLTAGPEATAWKMGEVRVFSHRGGLTEERLQCLQDSWQRTQLPKMGLSAFRPSPPKAFNRDIARLISRIEELKQC